MERMTGGQALARQLADEGVTDMFGLPGDQTMHAIDGIYDEPRLRWITTRHEQGTTYMADGYARVTGRPGVAFVVPGVGVYNAAAGLATAYACSSPVVLISGQIPRDGIGKGYGLLHEVDDQLDIVRPITAWQQRTLDPAGIPATVHEAFARVRRGRRRPVEIEFSPDTFSDAAEMTFLPRSEEIVGGADPDQVARAAEILDQAERPLVWAGGGVVLNDASAALTAVAEFLQAGVVTTREGKGSIDERNPLSIGTMWNNRRLQPILDDADVILAVGTRFSGANVAGTPVVHIDVDAAEIGLRHPNSYAVVGDAAPTLDALLTALQKLGDPRPDRTATTRAQRESVTQQLHAIGPAAGWVEMLRRAIPDDGVLVPCTTTIGYMCHMHFPVYEPRTYITTSYMGTLGSAFPTSLGAQVGVPDRPVVCVSGDGGFLFGATELATAVQYGINAVTVVFNDNAYGNSNRDQRERFDGRELGTELRNPDFAKFAEAFGADGVKLARVADLEHALAEAIANRRPTVIEVTMDRLPSAF